MKPLDQQQTEKTDHWKNEVQTSMSVNLAREFEFIIKGLGTTAQLK